MSPKALAHSNVNYPILERIVKIHAEIKSGKYPNVGELAKRLEVSIPTINRDVDFLKNRFNAPIEYDAKKRGYYYSEDFDMPLNSFSPEDLQTLFCAKMLLSSYEGTPVYDNAKKLIDFLTDSRNIGNSNFLNRIALPPTPKIIIDEKIWSEIVKAMQENFVIEFDYNGRWNPESSHRRVHPYQILLDDGVCFVFGFSEERDDERLFALNRIKKLTVTEEHFELPEDFDFSSRCGGGKFGAFMTDDKEKFTIDFFDESRQFVKDCVWADNQKISDFDDENRTRISFDSTQSLKILEWVLSQGRNARPVSPEWFVQNWKDEIKAMGKKSRGK
ncbi:MAG: WYL domain-containing protein [Treponema sp.]|nr:WYL domain-containing protein [Treponema sp.]